MENTILETIAESCPELGLRLFPLTNTNYHLAIAGKKAVLISLLEKNFFCSFDLGSILVKKFIRHAFAVSRIKRGGKWRR